MFKSAPIVLELLPLDSDPDVSEIPKLLDDEFASLLYEL
jgi:hypothetical protein